MFDLDADNTLAPSELAAWVLAGGLAMACLLGSVLALAVALRPLLDREEVSR
jgi:hypothetical protein